MLKKSELNNIVYSKTKKDVKEHVIIPTYIPSASSLIVRAIDVTDLPVEEQEEMVNLWNSYKEYLALQRKQTFSFTDFIEHETNKKIPVEWRSFKPKKLETN